MKRLRLLIGAGCLALSFPAFADGSSAQSSSQGPAPTALTELGCDANCVRANMDPAVQACAPRIEAEAPLDFDWILRPYGGIFQEASRAEGASTIVQYRGDSIRFLTPQNTWARFSYACGYDAAKHEVGYVQVRAGRLSQPKLVAAPAPATTIPARPAVQTAQPQQTAQAKPAPTQPRPTAAAGSTMANLKFMGEPTEVDVRQIPPGARPK